MIEPDQPFDIIAVRARLVQSYGEDATQEAFYKAQRAYPDIYSKPAIEIERLLKTIAYRCKIDEIRHVKQTIVGLEPPTFVPANDNDTQDNYDNLIDMYLHSHSPLSDMLIVEGALAYKDIVEKGYQASWHNVKRRRLVMSYMEALHNV